MSDGDAVAIQRTLTGEEADMSRVIPETMIHCEECDELVLRSRRQNHEHDLSNSEPGISPKTAESVEKVPEDAILDTQTYEVTFHYEVVETIRVEAGGKGEAKEAASHEQTYRGEYMDTLHTEKRPVTDPGQASIDYLELHGLLPDDHDVTPADIQRVIDHE